MSPEKEARNFAARLAFAAAFGLMIDLALQSPLPILLPLLSIQLLAKGQSAPSLGGAIKLIAGFTLIVLLVDNTLASIADRPVVFAILLALAYFLAFVLALHPSLNAVGSLMAVVITIVPTLAVGSDVLADEIADLMIFGIMKAAILVWLLHAVFPSADSPPRIVEKSGSGSSVVWALLSAFIITTLHLTLITSGEIAFVILISLTTLLAQADMAKASKFVLAALAGNLLGALAASILDTTLSIQPHWTFFALLTLGVAMVFAGRIARQTSFAPVFLMGLTSFITLFGLTQADPSLLSDVPVVSRLLQIAVGSAYALGMILVFSPTQKTIPS